MAGSVEDIPLYIHLDWWGLKQEVFFVSGNTQSPNNHKLQQLKSSKVLIIHIAPVYPAV